MVRLSGLSALVLCLALPALAQQTPAAAPGQSATPEHPPAVTLIPRSHEERESRYRAEHRILLNVVVTDASDKPVTGLKEEDFALLDDGHPQTIASFRAVEKSTSLHPAHVILVLDTINDTARSLENDRRAIQRFLKESPPHLVNPTALLVMSGSGAKMGPLSSERDALLAELDALGDALHPIECADEVNHNEAFLAVWMPGASGSSDQASHGSASSRTLACLNRRFERSVSELNNFARQQINVPARVILVWIGSGWPLLSSHEFRPDSPQIRQNFFAYLVELSTALRESQVTLDEVSAPDAFRKVEASSDQDNALFNGVPTEDQVTAGSLGLQALAHQSGGQILVDSKDIPHQIAQSITDDKAYYVLSFDSPPAATPGEFHPLRVIVNKPGLKVRTNTAYYAQP
jgi:VWFA-related protein